MRSPRAVAACLLGSLIAAAPAAAAPVVGTQTKRGSGTVVALPAQAPSAKTVDGQIADWAGDSPRYGGTTIRSAGELIYTDHIFDAWGADDGRDAEAVWGGLGTALPESYRLEAIMRNDPAGQVGAPWPEQLTFLDHYGDRERDGRADLTELRLGATAADLFVLARTTTMTAATDTAILLLLDTEAGDAERGVPFESGLTTTRAELAIELQGGGGRVADLRTGAVTDLPAGSVATNPDGWTNAVEARLDRAALGIPPTVAVAAAARRPGQPPANVAFRHDEPVREWFDMKQALALHAGSIDEFFATADLTALQGGASERYVPGHGYHDRIFRSSERVSREQGEDGILQHYGVYFPAGHDASRAAPLQLWLHWRGGTAHSAGMTIPGMFRDLGEAHGAIVVSPRGRGTSGWYVGRSQVDVEEVWADVHASYRIDARRRYVAGHSMGGWGSFLMTIIHPDWFAAALPASPPVTQGAWTGLDLGTQCDELSYDDYSPCYIEANGSKPRDQHTRRLLENVRHVPWAIYHGVEDELVPYSGVARQVERLTELRYRHRFYSFPTQEHFGPPVWDEWKAGGDYMHGFTAPVNPERVSFVRDMAFERATETVNSGGIELDFDFDGAYWMRGLEPVDEQAGRAVFEGRTMARPEAPHLWLPEAGGPSAPGQTGPFAMTGLRWQANPLATRPAAANGFEAKLTAARAVTLDAPRMGLDRRITMRGWITSDGPLTLSIAGFATTPAATVNGTARPVSRSGDVVTVELPAGSSALVLRP